MGGGSSRYDDVGGFAHQPSSAGVCTDNTRLLALASLCHREAAYRGQVPLHATTVGLATRANRPGLFSLLLYSNAPLLRGTYGDRIVVCVIDLTRPTGSRSTVDRVCSLYGLQERRAGDRHVRKESHRVERGPSTGTPFFPGFWPVVLGHGSGRPSAENFWAARVYLNAHWNLLAFATIFTMG